MRVLAGREPLRVRGRRRQRPWWRGAVPRGPRAPRAARRAAGGSAHCARREPERVRAMLVTRAPEN